LNEAFQNVRGARGFLSFEIRGAAARFRNVLQWSGLRSDGF
jgi:hypothetical protein